MIEYNIRQATVDDIPDLSTLQTQVRSLAVVRGELPSVDFVSALDAQGKLTEIINDGNRVILLAQIDGKIIGKGILNFYPDRDSLTLSSFEVAAQAEGLGIAVEFLKTGIRMAKEKYPQMQTLRMGRYDRSEKYRKHGRQRKTFFDWVAEQADVKVEIDDWKGEPMKYYNIPFSTADRLITWYEKLHHRFPVG